MYVKTYTYSPLQSQDTNVHKNTQEPVKEDTHLNCMACRGDCKGMCWKMSDVWALDPVTRWALVYISSRVHSPQSNPF